VEQYLQRCAGNETGLHGSVVVKVLLQRFSKREGACTSVCARLLPGDRISVELFVHKRSAVMCTVF
jgi:hypothetical protein